MKRKIITIGIIIVIIAVSAIAWYALTSRSGFKATVVNQSGVELYVHLFAYNDTEDYSEADVTTNGLENNASRSFNFKPQCKDFTFLVETRTGGEIDTEIAHAFHYFYNNELYDLVVTVEDSGENITITKMR